MGSFLGLNKTKIGDSFETGRKSEVPEGKGSKNGKIT